MTHGSYYLEDPSGVVKIDLSETKFHTGLYTENSFVLADGWFDDEIFHVLALGNTHLDSYRSVDILLL